MTYKDFIEMVQIHCHAEERGVYQKLNCHKGQFYHLILKSCADKSRQNQNNQIRIKRTFVSVHERHVDVLMDIVSD